MNIAKNFVSNLKLFWKTFLTCWAEWVVTVGLFALTGLISLTIYPKMRASYNNHFERYTYSGETLGSLEVGIFIVLIPFASITILSIIFPKKINICYAYLSLIQTLALTLLVTEALKVTVSRPRPNFFSYCGYNNETKQCHGKPKHQRDARLSFPSGHSSNSFSSGTWLTFFLSFMFPHTQIWWILFKFMPIAIATFVSATRIIDYMHHVSDVVGGAVIGIGIATMIFNTQSSRIFIIETQEQEEEQLLEPTASIL